MVILTGTEAFCCTGIDVVWSFDGVLTELLPNKPLKIRKGESGKDSGVPVFGTGLSCICCCNCGCLTGEGGEDEGAVTFVATGVCGGGNAPATEPIVLPASFCTSYFLFPTAASAFDAVFSGREKIFEVRLSIFLASASNARSGSAWISFAVVCQRRMEREREEEKRERVQLFLRKCGTSNK
jgi:hypothetical protein